jgi:hypothetical protein
LFSPFSVKELFAAQKGICSAAHSCLLSLFRLIESILEKSFEECVAALTKRICLGTRFFELVGTVDLAKPDDSLRTPKMTQRLLASKQGIYELCGGWAYLGGLFP